MIRGGSIVDGTGTVARTGDVAIRASRILQPSAGYVATLVNGVTTRRHDADTGERPGRLVCGQPA